jgi:Fe-S-cluster-containing dehydrogenase component/CRP-like cAMP-binding protein
MPREHTSRREVLNALDSIPSIRDLLSSHNGHYDHELDLEVIVYGRNYGGKKVGPYVRLITFDQGEAVIREGDWGGNTLYLIVDGEVDVFVTAPDQRQVRVARLGPGIQFGEMSVLAGMPRSATVIAAAGPAQVLEVQRPALRLLRKLQAFGDALDTTYRRHGRDAAIEDLKARLRLSPEQVSELKQAALFKVFSKNHVLFHEHDHITRLYVIRQGWLCRTQADKDKQAEDYLGQGFCFGAEGLLKDGRWPYGVTLMGRAEVLEIPIKSLKKNAALGEHLAREIAPYMPPPLGARVSRREDVRRAVLSAQKNLIDSGLVDATNLLVMDMDLCVRCGNCSLACHKMHGQSRLTRRGIHITRLKAESAHAIQSVLSPAVCLHCQDPECLTGCPTGAIGRFEAGQIDIEQNSCIGCGDCATQCPYNAISMIPRKSANGATHPRKGSRLGKLLRLSADPLPPAVEATEDLLAVKCNLCRGTTLNPAGAARAAYSCEENCPTGALARINPKSYFTEIGDIKGLLLVDSSHATGRNIHRSDPMRRWIHIAGVLLTVLLTSLCIYGLGEYGMGRKLWGFLNMRWLTGLVGLAGIIGVMFYPARRQIYKRRAGALRYWLLAHTYLGIIAAIIILLHGGKDSGGLLTTALMISFDLVILTGLFGIACYIVVPRMLTRIEETPLLIDDLRRRREELQKEIAETAGASSPVQRDFIAKRVVPRFTSFQYVLGQVVKRERLDDALERAKQHFAVVSNRINNPKERERLEHAIESAATLGRIEALISLHRTLKLWLPFHVITTSLMLALMTVHIIQVIYYASR